MAPKKHESGADGLTPEQLRAQADNARLLQRALDNGVRRTSPLLQLTCRDMQWRLTRSVFTGGR